MPYPSPSRRKSLDTHIDRVDVNSHEELEYALLRLSLNYLNCWNPHPRSVLGSLEVVRQELYGAEVAPRGVRARAQNGDIYDNDDETPDDEGATHWDLVRGSESSSLARSRALREAGR